MHIVDHVFILLLVLVYPVYSAWSYHREVRKIEEGKPANRMALYRSTVIVEWLALAVLFIAWNFLERPFSSLGFVAPGGAGFYAGIVLLAITCVILIRQWSAVDQLSDEVRQEQITALGKLVHFLPHSQRELRAVYGMSLTAGIVEEIVYRGFFMWYLALSMPMWAAAIMSSVAFGIAHSYQGTAGVVKCGVVGLAFAALYMLTGSIWLPMIGHFLFDALQGPAIYRLLKGRDAAKNAAKNAATA